MEEPFDDTLLLMNYLGVDIAATNKDVLVLDILQGARLQFQAVRRVGQFNELKSVFVQTCEPPDYVWGYPNKTQPCELSRLRRTLSKAFLIS
jgi:hypothetical protein